MRIVVAGGDVPEAARGIEFGVEERIEVAYGLAELLVDPGQERRPERGHGACAPDDGVLAGVEDLEARDGIGVAADIGNAAADRVARVDRCRDDARLPRRQRIQVADAAAAAGAGP